MQESKVSYRDVIAQAWVAMLLLLLTMLIVDIIGVLISGDYDRASELLSKDPGVSGLWFLSCLICINVLLQMTVRFIEKQKYRWMIFVLTLCYGVFFLAHQIFHLINGEGFGIHFLLDTTHDIVAVWALWVCYKWATTRNAADQVVSYSREPHRVNS